MRVGGADENDGMEADRRVANFRRFSRLKIGKTTLSMTIDPIRESSLGRRKMKGNVRFQGQIRCTVLKGCWSSLSAGWSASCWPARAVCSAQGYSSRWAPRTVSCCCCLLVGRLLAGTVGCSNVCEISSAAPWRCLPQARKKAVSASIQTIPRSENERSSGRVVLLAGAALLPTVGLCRLRHFGGGRGDGRGEEGTQVGRIKLGDQLNILLAVGQLMAS